jgi:lysophospholipase L1-like esterase
MPSKFTDQVHQRLLSLLFLLATAFLMNWSEAAAQTLTNKSKWETEIKAFEHLDDAKAPPRGAVLFVGSSSIRLWKTLGKDFPGLMTINRGFGGSQISDATQLADRIVIPYAPKTIVFYSGDNDIAAGRTPEQVRDDFRAFVEKVRKALPETSIAFLSIKPSIARWHLIEKIKTANQLVAADCKRDRGLIFVDIFPSMLGDDGKPKAELFVQDGLHMSAAGYELWAAQLRPVLK